MAYLLTTYSSPSTSIPVLPTWIPPSLCRLPSSKPPLARYVGFSGCGGIFCTAMVAIAAADNTPTIAANITFGKLFTTASAPAIVAEMIACTFSSFFIFHSAISFSYCAFNCWLVKSFTSCWSFLPFSVCAASSSAICLRISLYLSPSASFNSFCKSIIFSRDFASALLSLSSCFCALSILSCALSATLCCPAIANENIWLINSEDAWINSAFCLIQSCIFEYNCSWSSNSLVILTFASSSACLFSTICPVITSISLSAFIWSCLFLYKSLLIWYCSFWAPTILPSTAKILSLIIVFCSVVFAAAFSASRVFLTKFNSPT